jgi:hypothetical protein
MFRQIERSHPGFRDMHPVESGCGRFSAEEVRRLVPQDLRKHGCPETVFLRVLESRAKGNKEMRTYSREEMRERAKEVARIIALDQDADAQQAAASRVPSYNPRVWEA